MPKYLVTGGCGFIGSHLVEALLKEGAEVVALDNFTSGKKGYIPSQATIFQGSITDAKCIEKAVEDVDAIFHLAAIPSVQRSVTEWGFTHLINLSATISIFEAVAKHKKTTPIIYASSAAVYGSSTELPLKESLKVTPLSAYGADKLGCEQHAKVGWEVHKIPSIGLRLFNVYGPRQDPSSPYSGVISIFMNNIRKKQPLPICGSGEQTRDFISVHDVVKHFQAAAKEVKEGAEIYNVCRGVSVSINELADTIEDIAHVSTKREKKPARAGEVVHSLGDPTQAKKTFNIQATISLKEGLKELL